MRKKSTVSKVKKVKREISTGLRGATSAASNLTRLSKMKGIGPVARW